MNFRFLQYFLLLAIAGTSAFYCTLLNFKFDFNQFFPEGDKDLIFFNEFKKDFKGDDNFLLIAIPNKPSVFDPDFLKKVETLGDSLSLILNIEQVQSIVNLRYPIKTPFGYTTIPTMHLDDTVALIQDIKDIRSDRTFFGTLINEKEDMLIVSLQTEADLDMQPTKELLYEVEKTLADQEFKNYHLLGRANFQVVLTENQKREVFISSIISALLVSLVLYIIFKSIKVVFFSMLALGLTLLTFMGILGAMSRNLSVMAALYPVIIMIVGTADIVHILSKYYDELRKGRPNDTAISITLKEIGLATFITSLTTSIGFATLNTSRLPSIREFGWNSALGVMLAFFLILWLSKLLFPFLSTMHLDAKSEANAQKWDKLLKSIYTTSLTKAKVISYSFVVVTILCILAITQISTNYTINDNLPRGSKIATDFYVFEKEFAGFRPMELGITMKSGYRPNDFVVVQALDSISNYLRRVPNVNNVFSYANLIKSVNKANHSNDINHYTIPSDTATFDQINRLLSKSRMAEKMLLVNQGNNKTRISTRLKDIGADSIKYLGIEIDKWLANNVDSNMMEIRRTGTGLVMDKNSIYVTESLIYGLIQGIIAISLLMAFLLKEWRMVIISFITNFIPLLFAGALLYIFDIKLEASVGIIFTVIYGIAADDTIHFLSRYKLCIRDGLSLEEALKVTFEETGKPIIQTTVLLFFGFLVMLFSNNGPTFVAGLLMSVTLASAVLCDLYLLPILMRKGLKQID